MRIKKIQGFDYFVSDTGLVFNKHGQEIKRQLNQDGYWVVNLWDGFKYHHKRVNRLVATEFIENPNNLPVVNHIDHNRQNNHFRNLEWVTQLENKEKSLEFDWRMGKTKSHVDDVTVHKICQMIEEGYRNLEIEKILNIPRTSILDIRRGKSWTEISKLYKMSGSSRGVSEETVRWICRQLAEGKRIVDIVKESNSKYVTRSVVSKIKSGKTFKNISKEYL